MYIQRLQFIDRCSVSQNNSVNWYNIEELFFIYTDRV